MIKPMLAHLEPRPYNDGKMLWEEKFDGARLLAFVENGQVRLQARSGTDKSDLFPELAIETKVTAILDGEVTCATFNGIQHRINRGSGIAQASKTFPAQFKVFDVVEAKGIDLMGIPLIQRKAILQDIMLPNETTVVTPWSMDGVVLFDEMIAAGKEGVIGKPLDSLYIEDNRGVWIKAKCNKTEVFTVCGYTKGTGWREDSFGALVLGKRENGKLTYVGSVGTGFTCKKIAELLALLKENVIPESPFGYNPMGNVMTTWVMPLLDIKVRFLEYTDDGLLRFPAYQVSGSDLVEEFKAEHPSQMPH